MNYTAEDIENYRKEFLERKGYTEIYKNSEDLETLLSDINGQTLSYIIVSPEDHSDQFPENYNCELFVQWFREEKGPNYLFIISNQFDSEVQPLMAYTEYSEFFDKTTKGSAYLSAKKTVDKIIDRELRNKFASSYSKLLRYEIELFDDDKRNDDFQKTADFLESLL